MSKGLGRIQRAIAEFVGARPGVSAAELRWGVAAVLGVRTQPVLSPSFYASFSRALRGLVDDGDRPLLQERRRYADVSEVLERYVYRTKVDHVRHLRGVFFPLLAQFMSSRGARFSSVASERNALERGRPLLHFAQGDDTEWGRARLEWDEIERDLLRLFKDGLDAARSDMVLLCVSKGREYFANDGGWSVDQPLRPAVDALARCLVDRPEGRDVAARLRQLVDAWIPATETHRSELKSALYRLVHLGPDGPGVHGEVRAYLAKHHAPALKSELDFDVPPPPTGLFEHDDRFWPGQIPGLDLLFHRDVVSPENFLSIREEAGVPVSSPSR